VKALAGQTTITPGAMRNAAEKVFQPVFSEPMSQGMRCHHDGVNAPGWQERGARFFWESRLTKKKRSIEYRYHY
jgi:hypothetical protein